MDMEVRAVVIRGDSGHPNHFPAPGEGFKVRDRWEAKGLRPRDNPAGLECTHKPDITAVYLVLCKELHQRRDQVFSMVYPDDKNPARFSFGVLHDDLIRNYYRTQLKLIDWTKNRVRLFGDTVQL